MANRLLANNANSRLATTRGFSCGRARTPALRGRKLHKVRLPPRGRARQTAPVTPLRGGSQAWGFSSVVSETPAVARQRLTNDVSHCRAAVVIRLFEVPMRNCCADPRGAYSRDPPLSPAATSHPQQGSPPLRSSKVVTPRAAKVANNAT